MKKILLSVLLIGGLGTLTWGQDVHFSQYYSSPLTLSPAMTGLIDADWRATADYRNQWYNVNDFDQGYMTGTVSFDMPLLRGKLPEGDALGIGVVGLYDKSGTGGLRNTTLGLSVAYHKALGREKRHAVSLGAQIYIVQKSLQFDKLIFGDQFDPSNPTGYLPSTLENFPNSDLSYPDVNVGLMYTGQVSDHGNIYAGASLYHLTTPEESFLSESHNEDVKINRRYVGFAGGSFEFNDNIVGYFSTMYERQGPAWEYLIGGAVGFVMNPGHDEQVKNTALYLGLWYRYSDALIPYVGIEWSKMKIGLSYDVTVSSAQSLTGGQGAFELSLIYQGLIQKKTRQKFNFACPKF